MLSSYRLCFLVAVFSGLFAIGGCVRSGYLGDVAAPKKEKMADSAATQKEQKTSVNKGAASKGKKKNLVAAKPTALDIEQLFRQGEKGFEDLLKKHQQKEISVETQSPGSKNIVQDERGKFYHQYYLDFYPVKEIENLENLYKKYLHHRPGHIGAKIRLANLMLLRATNSLNRISELQAEETKIANEINNSLFVEKREEKTVRIASIKQEVANLKKEADLSLSDSHTKCSEVITIDRLNSSALLGVGMTLTLQKKYPEAVRKFKLLEEAQINVERNRSILYLWYGFALENQGQKDQAKVYYQKAAELNEPVGSLKWVKNRIELK